MTCEHRQAAGDDQLAQLSGATAVSAYGGYFAWSELDVATGRYYLTMRFGGVTTRMPVAPRTVAFHVDLGADATGRTLAVYSRCSTERSRYFARSTMTCCPTAALIVASRRRRVIREPG